MNTLAFPTAAVLAFYCGLVLLASLAGGWLLLALRLTHTRLQTAVSFVAGLMLGMALLHFIPHAFQQSHALDQTMQWTLGGFLVMFFLQRFFPHHHHDVSEGGPEHGSPGAAKSNSHPPAEHSARPLLWIGTTVGLTLHSLTDGVALAAAVAAEGGGQSGLMGLGTALVIVLHKPFDAMAISTLMAAGGSSRFARHLLNGLFALVTPLGAMLFYVGASHFFGANPVFLGGALAFCAGTFLCIAGADLLPELQFHAHDRFQLSLALLAGLGVAVVAGQLGHASHDHHPEPAPVQTGQEQLR